MVYVYLASLPVDEIAPGASKPISSGEGFQSVPPLRERIFMNDHPKRNR